MSLVVSVVGVLLTAPTNNVDDGPVNPRMIATRIELQDLSHALGLYRSRIGAAPSTSEGLQALTEGPQRVMDRVPRDHWGHPYVYRAQANGDWTLYSLGQNGIDDSGAGDDIVDGKTAYANGCEIYGVGCPLTARDILPFACVAAAALSLLGIVASLVMWVIGRRQSAQLAA